MTEDASAGRLYIEAVSDTSGFGRALKRKIDAEVRDVKARIRAEVDTRGLIGQARAAAKAASKEATVRFKTELDTRGLIGQARAAAKAAADSTVVRLRAEVDSRGVVAETKAAATAAAEASKVDVKVGADTSEAEADIAAVGRGAGKKVDVPVGFDARQLAQMQRAIAGLSRLPALAGGVQILTSAVVGLGGGLFAMGAAASQAVGTLAMIPNLAGIAGQGIAALVIGFSGIGDAVGALGKAQQTAAADTATAAAAQEAAAERVTAAQEALVDAQRGVTDARREAGRAAADSARRIADAEREIADANRGAVRAQLTTRRAQEDLNRVRAEARERIRDLNLELKHSATDEAAAALAVRKAREDLQDVNWDAASTGTEKAEAEQRVREAVDRLEQVREKNDDLRKETRQANKEGVAGQSDVQDAQARVHDAMTAQSDAVRAQRDAVRGLALAQQQAAQSQADSARRVAAAQRGVIDAQRALVNAQQAATTEATKTSAAMTAQQQAMDKLSPAGQRFARFIYGLKPRWEELRNGVQQALLPPIQRGVTAALPFLDTLQDGLEDTAALIGSGIERLGTYLGSDVFNADATTIMASNNRALASFGGTAFNLLHIFQDMAVAVGPLVERFADWTESVTAGWRATINAKRETGELRDFFNEAGDVAALLGDIIGNVAGALFNMGSAGSETGRDLLKTLRDVTQRWQDWTGSEEGQDRMREFFEATKPVTEEIGRLVSNLAEFLTKMGEAGGGPLVGFLGTLNLILDGINALMGIPGVAPVIGTLLTLAGVGGALGLVSAGLLGIGKNLLRFKKVPGLGKLISGLTGLDDAAGKSGKSLGGKFVAAVKGATKAILSGAKAALLWVGSMVRSAGAALLFTVRLLAQKGAQAALWVASKAMRLAVLAWTAAQWLLNAALNANPIGLVVLALIALAGAVYLAWTRSAVFRKVVTGAWNAIKAAVAAAWNNVIKPALTAFWSFLRDKVGPAVSWLWSHIVKPYFTLIGKLIRFYWNNILKPIFSALRTALTAVGRAAKWMWENAIKPAWEAIKSAIKWGWDHVIKPAFSRFKTAIEGLGSAFSTAVTAIKKAWDAIKSAVKKPIKAVLELVNKWVIGKFNWVSKKFNGPTIDPIDLKGFYSGGTIPGHATGPRADNVLIRATPEEFMVRQQSAQRLRREQPGALEYMNTYGRLPGYARGGFVRPVKAQHAGVWGRYRSGGSHPALDFPTAVGSRVVSVMDGVVRSVRSMVGSYGKHMRVSHGGGLESLYAHLSSFASTVGQSVKAGQIIARSGNTGNSTGPHLHLEMLRDGVPFNFTSMLRGGKAPKGGDGDGFWSGLGSRVMGILSSPVKWLRGQIKRPLDALLERFGDSPLAKMVTGVPTRLVSAAGAKIKSLFGFGEDTNNASQPINPSTPEWSNRAIVQAAAMRRGWTGPQWAALDWLVNKESGYRNTAQNPISSAYGMFQFLDSTWAGFGPKTSDPGLQAKYGLDYIAKRYGTPAAAKAFHEGHNWYDAGGWLMPGRSIVDNGTGKPEAVLTHDQWGGLSRLLGDIAAAARGTRNTTPAGGTGLSPLVGSLAVSVADPADLPTALDEVDFRLRTLRRGGVHASRAS